MKLNDNQIKEVSELAQKILKSVGSQNPIILANACLMVIQIAESTYIEVKHEY